MSDLICVAIVVVLFVLVLVLLKKLNTCEFMDTDPGGFSKYAGQTTSPFYEYDEKPMYGRYA